MSTNLETFKLNDTDVFYNHPMSEETSFKTGGPADIFVRPKSIDAFVNALQELRGRGIDIFIMGGGSNLLVRDGGIRGAVITTSALNGISAEGNIINVEAGAKLSRVCSFAHSNGLVGFEFAGGIPGTVGGGVFMNAGAYGGEMKDVVRSVCAADKEGNLINLEAKDLELSYRKSAVEKLGIVVLSAKIELSKGDVAAAREYLLELNKRRRDKQPVEFPSAGSTFKRPEGNFAGTLIEKAGLKGRRVGGAEVSTKHAGFIINIGKATTTDILALIDIVKSEVYEQFGVMLEPEVRMVGENL